MNKIFLLLLIVITFASIGCGTSIREEVHTLDELPDGVPYFIAHSGNSKSSTLFPILNKEGKVVKYFFCGSHSSGSSANIRLKTGTDSEESIIQSKADPVAGIFLRESLTALCQYAYNYSIGKEEYLELFREIMKTTREITTNQSK